jgi:hypothetical protein
MSDEHEEHGPQGDGPQGDGAINEVGGSREPSLDAQHNALAYFMGDVPAPGKKTRLEREVNFGEPGGPDNFQMCIFRTLANEEIVKCEQEATVRDDNGERVVPFSYWSYVFAYSCQSPNHAQALFGRKQKLQAALTANPEDGEAEAEFRRLTDTAALVREVFRFTSGVIQAVAGEISPLSKVGEDKEKLLREVEAGKDLS